MKNKLLLGLLALAAVSTVPLRADAAADAVTFVTVTEPNFYAPGGVGVHLSNAQVQAFFTLNASVINASEAVIASLSPAIQRGIADAYLKLNNVSLIGNDAATWTDQNNIVKTYFNGEWIQHCCSLSELQAFCTATPLVYDYDVVFAYDKRFPGNQAAEDAYMAQWIGKPIHDVVHFPDWFRAYLPRLYAQTGGLALCRAAIQSEIIYVRSLPPTQKGAAAFIQELRGDQQLYKDMQ